jgi:hypothetical protein
VDGNVVLAIVLAAVGTLAVVLAAVFALAGFEGGRVALALRVLRDGALADKIKSLAGTAAPKADARPDGTPLRLLALLQRDARLVDFLTEDVSGASDAQVGEFARKMQLDAKKVLDRHLVLEPVLPQAEGEKVEVPPGFDPSAVRLTGNVTGQPPFKGELKHPGWRVKQLKLDALPSGQDLFVLMPAEVELP